MESLKEKYQPKQKITYTTILHQKMKELDISFYEYCISDFIFKMGGADKSREMGGWVYASKQEIAENLCITRRGVHKAINNLINKDLLEKHPRTKHLRTTQKWFNEVVVEKGRIKRHTM